MNTLNNEDNDALFEQAVKSEVSKIINSYNAAGFGVAIILSRPGQASGGFSLPILKDKSEEAQAHNRQMVQQAFNLLHNMLDDLKETYPDMEYVEPESHQSVGGILSPEAAAKLDLPERNGGGGA